MSEQPTVPTQPLANGAQIPRLGLGTWPMSDAEAERAVAEAVTIGYRLVDTAYKYGNEKGVGRGLRASGVAREDLFVTSKLNGEWHGREAVREAFQDSIGRLGLDYLDLYLIHWPMPWQDRYVDAFLGLTDLLREGRVRAIGLSNFKPAHIDRVLAATDVTPDVNQIQLDPTLTREAARAYHQAHGIVTQSWGPIGHGGELLAHPAVTEIADRHGRTPAQIVLRWHLELGLIPIPKTSSPERMKSNIDVFDFALAPAEVAALSALDRGEDAATDSDTTGH
ncbi:aldo/keto reductase [Plantactinospora sp. S1510]|uniref:Aldo/keto reductase n=1 Tax=Plantactinospora alkalitolerans TaxID=2789879 RepID=A0ABS0H9I5_9ACTN|nr:aldo/keto reductase [Plantactinospora alkalitolerans]MBF9135133.1 aldo/keto reductase [Plantactinospora alkalitolerans]